MTRAEDLVKEAEAHVLLLGLLLLLNLRGRGRGRSIAAGSRGSAAAAAAAAAAEGLDLLETLSDERLVVLAVDLAVELWAKNNGRARYGVWGVGCGVCVR